MKYIKTYEQKKQSLNDKLEILKSYISTLFKNGIDVDLIINYFTILHNFLILETIFPDKKYEINKYLYLENLDNTEDILDTFNSLYDVNSVIRNNIEKIDVYNYKIEKVAREFPKIYNKLLTDIDVDKIKIMDDIKKYNI